MTEGVDYSWSRPGGAALAAAGKCFAGRYLYPGGGKGLTAGEVNDLHAHGILVFTIFESSAMRALDGFAAGAADARTAQGQLAACGLPADQVVYFGVDFDATDAQLAAIDDYLHGAGSVHGQELVGVYGSYRVTTHCRASGSAPHGFQTYAWSWLNHVNQIDDGADFYQYNNGQTLNGSVDLVRSLNGAELAQTGSLIPITPDPPVILSRKNTPMYLKYDTNGAGYLFTDLGSTVLTGQEWELFKRLKRANEVGDFAVPTTDPFLPGEMAIIAGAIQRTAPVPTPAPVTVTPGAGVTADQITAAMKPLFDALPAAVRAKIIAP